MSEDEVECEYCGESFHPQGIAAHQRHCEPGEDDEGESERMLEPIEEKANSRDGGLCVGCGTDRSLVFHRIDPDIEGDVTNIVTLCADCESKIEGLRPLTKRTKIFH
jgi:hypothetical protein